MSRSKHCGYPREKLVKFDDKRTGWYGESCFAAEGRKFIKRLQRRHNRRNAAKVIEFELISVNPYSAS